MQLRPIRSCLTGVLHSELDVADDPWGWREYRLAVLDPQVADHAEADLGDEVCQTFLCDRHRYVQMSVIQNVIASLIYCSDTRIATRGWEKLRWNWG